MTLRNAIVLTGCFSVVVGIALLSVPFGLIAAGAAAIAIALLSE